MEHSIKILKFSDNFYNDVINYPNTENCSIIKHDDGALKFYTKDFEKFITFCSSEFFKENVYEVEKSELTRFAVSSVWHNSKGNFQQFISIVEGVDLDHAKGIHQRYVRENNENIKTGGYSLFLILATYTNELTKSQELK